MVMALHLYKDIHIPPCSKAESAEHNGIPRTRRSTIFQFRKLLVQFFPGFPLTNFKATRAELNRAFLIACYLLTDRVSLCPSVCKPFTLSSFPH